MRWTEVLGVVMCWAGGALVYFEPMLGGAVLYLGGILIGFNLARRFALTRDRRIVTRHPLRVPISRSNILN